jgi:peptide/nickel transport system substrate-binding protein
MTDRKFDELSIIAELVRNKSLDRRKLFQTAAAMGLSTAGAGAALTQVGPVAAQESDLKLLTVSEQQLATFTRNFNPLIPNDNSRWPTQGGVYEPMAIYNTFAGELRPWLATSWEFSEDLLTITWTLQEGVTWSDGTPFTSADVKFTFDLLLANDGLSGTGGIRGTLPLLATVETPDETTVVMTMSEVNTLAIFDYAEQMIVPMHIWESIEDPVTFLNDQGDPVGTGPFTVVAQFQDQYYELHKNPTYWQEGKPLIDGLRLPSYPTNDAANLASINGENDWAANFIPDIENTFVSADPEHHHYWFPPLGATVHLWLNTTIPPFDNVDVRKAISMAVDREQIVAVAMYDYTRPADSSGLSDAYPALKTTDESTQGTWVVRDVDAANAALDAAGLTRDGDVRVTADGSPMEYELNVVTGWSDWVSAVQIIAQNLEEVGIMATVTPYDFAAWFDRMTTGDFTMSIGWAEQGPTPFNFYRGAMSPTQVRPVGESNPQNWHRFGLPEADDLLNAMGQTTDTEERKAIVAQLQALYNENAPGVPLFPGPQWGEYTTHRFDDFPDEGNEYSILSTWDNPERLQVMTTIKPVESE